MEFHRCSPETSFYQESQCSGAEQPNCDRRYMLPQGEVGEGPENLQKAPRSSLPRPAIPAGTCSVGFSRPENFGDSPSRYSLGALTNPGLENTTRDLLIGELPASEPREGEP